MQVPFGEWLPDLPNHFNPGATEAKNVFPAVNSYRPFNDIAVTSSNALDDFRYLLSANKLYCAPSTFSWWALHSLSINSEVIIPKIFKKHLGVFIRLKKITVI